MMQKIQKFGGAMFTPVMLFAFAGVVIGFGTLFTTEVIFWPLATPGTMWYGVWNVILQGGWTVFNQLPLLFAVSLPIGLANKQNARCCNPEEQIGIDIIKKALTAPVATIASLILITEATVSDVPKNTQLEDAIAAATAGAQGGGMY